MFPVPRVNVPYLGSGPPAASFTPSIFWFGKVTPTTNYADVRMWYYDDYIKVMVNVIDRRVWYDPNPSAAEMDQWDTVSLYMDVDGSSGGTPDQNSYRFDSEVNWWEERDRWQNSLRGHNATWAEYPVSFTTESTYRGLLNNDENDHGWQTTFIIPFVSLGQAEPPSHGTIWGLAVSVHDRDSAAGEQIDHQVWPEHMNPDNPSSWGQLHFGSSSYSVPAAIPTETITIRKGLNGITVTDGHVGGHGNCGDGLDVWSEWGEANYVGYSQVNVQNQWDISDFPCFSKYFVTFPLDSVPADSLIMRATLTMNIFGNAGGGQWGEPPISYIHALTIEEDWNEQTLTWNNAPLAVENISGTWVKPIQMSEQRQYSWDVTAAASTAIDSAAPLRLALYSIDGERHSGKYFWSSDVGDWGEAMRPTLEVVLGTVCSSPEIDCHFNFFPMIVH